MVVVAVKGVPAGSKPAAAVSVRISTGETHSFGAAAPLSTMASSLQGRAGGSVESSPKPVRHRRAGNDPFCQTAIPVLRLICRSVLRMLVSFSVSFYVCLQGETWLPIIMLKAC